MNKLLKVGWDIVNYNSLCLVGRLIINVMFDDRKQANKLRDPLKKHVQSRNFEVKMQ